MDLGQKQTAAAEKLMALISGSRTRPVADSNSVVTDRTITNVKGNNFNMAVNTEKLVEKIRRQIALHVAAVWHSRRDTAGLSGQETWWPPHSPPVSITSRAQGSSNSTHHKTRSTFHHHPLPDLQPALFPITSVYSGCLLTYIKRKTLNRVSL
ncbi:uncharacterized protein LOC120569614 isoform X8 [Perca fluviatilis]|uniref:uncharacterized protein LOC120569614 isoform X8 n=1 Tax=Perca fluviatilis TaxID=8168 RepID=UPI00196378A3|nr:uncharacterized protein LOC120569614 isoform X8 [Perca fluviatilis]